MVDFFNFLFDYNFWIASSSIFFVLSYIKKIIIKFWKGRKIDISASTNFYFSHDYGYTKLGFKNLYLENIGGENITFETIKCYIKTPNGDVITMLPTISRNKLVINEHRNIPDITFIDDRWNDNTDKDRFIEAYQKLWGDLHKKYKEGKHDEELIADETLWQNFKSIVDSNKKLIEGDYEILLSIYDKNTKKYVGKTKYSTNLSKIMINNIYKNIEDYKKGIGIIIDEISSDIDFIPTKAYEDKETEKFIKYIEERSLR